MKLLARRAATRLKRQLRTFPAVLIFGPRQCGKTTFARSALPGWKIIDLESHGSLRMVAADVEGFLLANPKRLAFDEAQVLPELFPALRHVIDRARAPGRFVLLGSANPLLLRSTSESLTGRLGMLELTPFRAVELAGSGQGGDRWFWGGFPPVHQLRGAERRMSWFDSYVATFIQRDLPALGFRLQPERVRILWTMLTHVHGNLLNVSDLAQSLSVSSHTVNDYLDALEATFMIRRLRPYHTNAQKRLVKAPKVYVRDTGLLHFLADLRHPSDLETWPRRGASFEGMVIEELATWASDSLVRPSLNFWRTQTGSEVDLLIKDGSRLFPIEVKLGTAPDRKALAGLRQCMQDLSLKRGWVITGSGERHKVGGGIEVVPWPEVLRGGLPFLER